MATVKEIAERFTLKTHFIYECLRKIALLQPHIQQAEKNAKIIDEQGVLIFEKIAELKQKNLTLPEIQKQIDGVSHGDVSNTQKTGPETKQIQEETEGESSQTQIELAWFHQYTAQLQAMQDRLDEQQQRASQELAEREKLIRDLLMQKAGLQADLKALPSKETYENDLKQRQEAERNEQEKRRKAAQIMGELKATNGILKGKRRRELLKQLEELLS